MTPGRALTTAAVVLVLAATLFPAHHAPAEASPWCLTCDETWLADFLGNVLLFLPFGIAVGARRRGVAAALLGGALLSVGVELSQTLVPGRTTAVRDVLSNTLGAGIGAALVHSAPRWLTPARPRRWGLGALAAAFAVVLGGGWLSAPDPAEGELRAWWRPSLPGRAGPYGGPLLEVRVDGIAVPDGGAVPPEALAHVRAGTSRTSVRVRWVGAPPERRSLLALVDGRGRERVSYDVRRTDVIRTVWTRGARIGLRRQELWLRDAAAPPGPDAGESSLTFVRDGARVCASAGGPPSCQRILPVSGGWTAIQGRSLFPGAWGHFVDALWLALLFFPAGLWMRRVLVRTIAASALLLVALPPMAGMSPAMPWEILAVGAGLALGGLAQPLLTRLLAGSPRPPRPEGPPWRSLASAWRQRDMRR